MKNLLRLAALAACVLVGACSLFTSDVTSPAPAPTATASAVALNPAQAALFKVRAAYDAAFLVPAANYAQLPACGSANATEVCSDPAVVAKLRQADKTAKDAFDAAEKIAATSPLTDPVALLADVNTAATAAEQIVTDYNIQ